MEKTYETEKEFLENYDSTIYEKLSMTVDLLIFSVSNKKTNNYRKLDRKCFSVLMVKRKDHPFKNKWCLPGGFIGVKETLEEAGERILAEETNLHKIYTEQLYTNSEINRDPRMRIVSTSYMALVDKDKLTDTLSLEASWFNITVLEDEEKYSLTFDNEKESFVIIIEKILTEKTTEKYDYKIIKNEHIAFDHAKTIIIGINRLKNKIEYTDIVFNMMGSYFTLGELQQVYEVILGKKLLDPAFRRIIKDKVIKTEKVKTGGGHRPSVLYKYKGE
ncbi:MAG: NUDIX hydrolase [Bacilli bacterium]|nr:NUDIX hydrolase [Bacilli bacterium]